MPNNPLTKFIVAIFLPIAILVVLVKAYEFIVLDPLFSASLLLLAVSFILYRNAIKEDHKEIMK